MATDNEFIEHTRCHYGQAGVLQVLYQVPLAFSLVPLGRLCHEEEVIVAHAGIALRCQEVRTQSLGEPVGWPDRTVSITGIASVVTPDDMPLLAEALVRYLANAGNEAS